MLGQQPPISVAVLRNELLKKLIFVRAEFMARDFLAVGFLLDRMVKLSKQTLQLGFRRKGWEIRSLHRQAGFLSGEVSKFG
jgi:hypothetical protein